LGARFGEEALKWDAGLLLCVVGHVCGRCWVWRLKMRMWSAMATTRWMVRRGTLDERIEKEEEED
jgi:hypothetical protein